MPLQRCGKNGWRWGQNGKCYEGPGGKKKAIKQALAIDPAKFKQEVSASELLEAYIIYEDTQE